MEVQEDKCPYCAEPFGGMWTISNTAEIVQIFPFPAINLTTGEEYEAEPPYLAIHVVWATEGYENEEDYIPIHYCPICGQKLETPKQDSNGFWTRGG